MPGDQAIVPRQRTADPDPEAPGKDRLICRRCGFSVLKWRTGRRGKPISGWRALQDHLFEAHDIEADLVGEST